MESSISTLLEKLRAHGTAAEPHESLIQDGWDAIEARNLIQSGIIRAKGWEEARPLHAKFREAEEKAEHLRLQRPDALKQIQKHWIMAVDDFTAGVSDLRRELEAAAGEPVKFGSAEVFPSTFDAISEKLIQRQVAAAKINRHHFQQAASEGRECIALIEEIAASLPAIKKEARALAAAAESYSQALAQAV